MGGGGGKVSWRSTRRWLLRKLDSLLLMISRNPPHSSERIGGSTARGEPGDRRCVISVCPPAQEDNGADPGARTHPR
ncbi:hypothetical protein FKM82_027073 [Ascaphus truei]